MRAPFFHNWRISGGGAASSKDSGEWNSIETAMELHEAARLDAQEREQFETFVKQRFSTIDQVDILQLLLRDPERWWSALDVAAALKMPPESAAMRLFLLASAGFVTMQASGVPQYRHRSDPESEGMLRQLADEWTRDRSSVASLFGVSAADPLRSFSDAFKLKR
jgi:hypothetical protein